MSKKLQKILCIQPHSDDVLLSASHVLLNGDYEVQVLCVESDPKRVPEDQRLYEFLNIPYANLGIEFVDNSYYEFRQMYKGACRWEEVLPFCEEYFGKTLLKDLRDALIAWVVKFRKKNPDCQILAPMGIGHPFHLYVHEVLRAAFPKLGGAMQFYREFPHSYKKRAQEQLREAQAHMVLSRSVPIDDFADVKWRLASKFYRTQSGLLFYEQGYIKKNLPEEIYVEL